MTKRICAHIEWIRETCGGRCTGPIVGLRPTVRWQRHIDAWLSSAWDAEITGVEPSEEIGLYKVEMQFVPHAAIEEVWCTEGEPIELLDAYRVIGVGVVTAP